MSRTVKLTDPNNFNVSKIIFSTCQDNQIPNTPIQYKRMNISVLHDDGSVGDLILPTERLYSFGVSENKDAKTQEVNGYTLPLCLWNKNGATKEEKAFTDTFNNIVEHVKNHLMENKEEIGKGDLEDIVLQVELRKLNPLYYKKDPKTKKVVEGTGPTLYAKLIQTKKDNKILSMFCDEAGADLNPMNLIGKRCFVRAAIKIESVFIGGGGKINLQVKLYQAVVEPIETGMKPLLNVQRAPAKMIPSDPKESNNFSPLLDEPKESGEGSLPNSDTEDAPVKKLVEPIKESTVSTPAAPVKKVAVKLKPKVK